MAISSSLPTPGVGQPVPLYEQVGGMEFFVQLVDRFYNHVSALADLIALYPEQDDLSGAKERLALFLAQYWGGPTTYSDRRGHPRLRKRHMEFVVDDGAAMMWLAAIRAAMDEMEIAEDIDETMWTYFTLAAPAMRNA